MITLYYGKKYFEKEQGEDFHLREILLRSRGKLSNWLMHMRNENILMRSKNMVFICAVRCTDMELLLEVRHRYLPKKNFLCRKKSFTFPGTSPLSVDTTPNIFNLKRSFESAFAKKESSSNGCAEKRELTFSYRMNLISNIKIVLDERCTDI